MNRIYRGTPSDEIIRIAKNHKELKKQSKINHKIKRLRKHYNNIIMDLLYNKDKSVANKKKINLLNNINRSITETISAS